MEEKIKKLEKELEEAKSEIGRLEFKIEDDSYHYSRLEDEVCDLRAGNDNMRNCWNCGGMQDRSGCTMRQVDQYVCKVWRAQ